MRRDALAIEQTWRPPPETRRRIAEYLAAGGLEAELILTSMETYGAPDWLWVSSGGGNREGHWPIPLP